MRRLVLEAKILILKCYVVRPRGFEPLTFCSGGAKTAAKASICYILFLCFQQYGASAFAQPTTLMVRPEGVLIQF